MKRIAIVTWTRWRNYGTILQSYALQKVVQRLGYDVYVLRDTNIQSDYNIKNNNTPTLYERIKAKIRRTIKNPKMKPLPYWTYDKELYDKCESFRLRNIRYWNIDFDNSDLSKIEPHFDVFICGSDQIWISAEGLFSSYYFLDFVKHKPKISYAPSISNKNYSQAQLTMMSKWLESFSAVSVREKIGREVLSKVYPPQKIKICLDPTLLLSGQEWIEMLNLNNIPKDYVFCYYLGHKTWYKQDGVAFCESKGLEMVYPPMIEADYKVGSTECCPDPKEFLELILNAKYVLTDSLHALIFSFLFRKEVFVFPRFMDEDPASENSRIEELTQILGLQDRLIKKKGAILLPAAPIDYSTVLEKIALEKESSIQWLCNSLNI